MELGRGVQTQGQMAALESGSAFTGRVTFTELHSSVCLSFLMQDGVSNDSACLMGLKIYGSNVSKGLNTKLNTGAWRFYPHCR
jgi:hypothetical protein